MVRCEYEFDEEPSPRPSDIIGRWYRRMAATGAAHKIVAADYLGISTVAKMRCGLSCYINPQYLLRRRPRTKTCQRCARP